MQQIGKGRQKTGRLGGEVCCKGTEYSTGLVESLAVSSFYRLPDSLLESPDVAEWDGCLSQVLKLHCSVFAILCKLLSSLLLLLLVLVIVCGC